MKRSHLALYSALILTFANSAFAAKSFSDEQKTEIGQVVHDYLVAHPEVISEAIQALQMNEMKAFIEKAKQGVASNIDGFFNSESPTNEVKDPNVSVVEFFDYNCPHCKVMSKILNDMTGKNNQLRIVYKELPVLSEGSLFAAKVALAAREQNKYEAVHQKFIDAKEALTQEKILSIAKELGLDMEKLNKDISSDKVNNELTNNRKLAMSIGLRGTPGFVIGKYPASKEMKIEFVPGEMKQDEFEKLVDSVK